jgi:hypothetical protein
MSPLVAQSGQKWILARDGLSAFDPLADIALGCQPNWQFQRAMQPAITYLTLAALWSVLHFERHTTGEAESLFQQQRGAKQLGVAVWPPDQLDAHR